MNWNDVLREPSDGDHIMHTYQDRGCLAEAVAEYLGTGLARGEAAIIVARPAHSAAFLQPLANILLSLAASHQSGPKMPSGQATLLWLSQNMPRTADKVLREVKASTATQ